MNGYTKSETPKLVLELLESAKKFVAVFPDTMPNGDWISCHAIAQVLTEHIPGVVRVDGHFGKRGFWHSWLMPEAHRQWVIDPYPIAEVGGPVARHVVPWSPWSTLYMDQYKPPFSEKEVAEQVSYLKGVIRGTE